MVKKGDETQIVLKYDKNSKKQEEFELTNYQILLLDVLERIAGGLIR